MQLKRNIRLLSLFNFFTDFKLYSAFAILYFAEVTGSFLLGMSVFSLVQLSSAIFEIPTGIYSDKIGRKKTVILGALAATLMAIFYALGGNFYILAVGAIFEGLSRAFYSGNNNALLHDTLAADNKTETYAKFLGKTSAYGQFALGLSALLGGILGSYSFQLIMWLSVIPQVICLIISLFLIEPQVIKKETGNIYSHLKQAIKLFITNKKLRLLSLSAILAEGFGESAFHFQSAFYQTVWPIWAIGFAKVGSYVGATLSFVFSGFLIKKFSEIKMLISANLYSRLANLTALLFPSIVSPALMSTTSIFYGVAQVSKNALMQKEFTQEQRATMASLNSLAGSLFFAGFAPIVGLVADKLTPAQALIMINLLQFIILFIYWRIFKAHS
ncbi:MFS transporter [Candidatus Daviesbacteria bacterium]|nr:MFS transporter [Candidatus Daviesbacteria bacterium]